MNAITRGLEDALGHAGLMQALPVGIVMYDANRRLSFVNAAVSDIVGVPAGTLQIGSELADNLRLLAYRDVFGPGDRDAQVEELLRLDLSLPHAMRRQRPDGRSYDASYVPMPGGAHAICLVETTGMLGLRDKSEKESQQAVQVLNGLRSGLAIFGADRRLMQCNSRFRDLTGLASQDMLPGLTFWEFVQNLHKQRDYATFDGEAFLATQISLDRTRSHQVRWTRGTGQVIEIASDPLPSGGWTMTLMDVSALARAEDDSRLRAEQLDGILRQVPYGICVWGADRRVAMFNRAYTDIMRGATLSVGEHQEQVLRRRVAAGEFGDGDIETIVTQQLSFDVTRPQSHRRQRPNGTTIDIRTAPLPDGGHVTVICDVTSLVQAEAEACRRAAEINLMLASTRHGIVLWGPDRRVKAFNHAAEVVQELRPGFLVVGRSMDDVMAELKNTGAYGKLNDADAYIRKLNARDPKKPYSRVRITPSGRALEIRSDPTPEGGWVATYTDISATRQLEAELRQARDAAESAGSARSRFMSTMSHELRTPLNAVIGFSDALMRAGRDGTADLGLVEEYGESINKSGRDLLGLIDTILDATRLEAGQFELSNDRIDLHYLVRTCVKQAQGAAEAAHVSLEVSLPDGLPLFQGDERRLRQVLTQLLTNAIKFTDTQAHGDVRVFAQYAALAPDAEPNGARDLMLCVADNGIGIPEADLERVFEPFTQVDASLSRRVEGSGLGLYIGRALMRAHGGDLTLRSRVREGTTAVLRLPAERQLPSVAGGPISKPSFPQLGVR